MVKDLSKENNKNNQGNQNCTQNTHLDKKKSQTQKNEI